MNVIYLETSSLLKVLFREEGYESTAQTLEGQDRVVTSSLTLIECRRAISRSIDSNLIKESQARVLIGALISLSRSWDILQISDTIQTRAGERFPVEPVRTLDAIHLASALEFKMPYPDLRVATSDGRILENLQPLGLEVV